MPPSSQAKTKEKPDRPPASLNGADWGSSDAKHLIVQDMMDGLVSCEEPIKNVRHLFDEMYAHQPEFRDFPFDQERYKSRFTRIQKVVKRLKWAAEYDSKCLEEARALYPQQTHGPTGVILWENSEADRLLKEDMANGLHLTMKPGDLFQTRECYKTFGKRRFSKRIDQLREAAKPYGLNPQQAAEKREKKHKNKVKNRPNYSRKDTTAPYSNQT